MTSQYGDILSVAHSKLDDLKKLLVPLFPGAETDVLLKIYSCTYILDAGNGEASSLRGQFCVGRNAFYFTPKDPPSPDLPIKEVNLSIPYRDVNMLDIVGSKRVLAPDCIQIGSKEMNQQVRVN